jgi:hypothetical protein
MVIDGNLLVIFGFTSLMVIGFPIARAFARRLTARSEQVQRQLPDDLSARLQRIEQITEATQIEVERLAEGQRFTTKLLSERSPVREPRGDS